MPPQFPHIHQNNDSLTNDPKGPAKPAQWGLAQAKQSAVVKGLDYRIPQDTHLNSLSFSEFNRGFELGIPQGI